MKKFILMSCLVGLISGCGGGRTSADSDSTTKNNNAVASYTPTLPKLGDTYVYQDTTSYNLGAANSTVTTNITRKVNQIGSKNELTVTDYYSNYNIYSFDLSEVSTNLNSNTGCSFSSSYNILPTPWSVGEVANQNIVETCPYSSFNIQISTQAIDYESITVKAGTFNTIKTQITKVATGGVSAASPAYTESETCWYDVVSGFAVKCTGGYDYSASIGGTVTGYLLLSNIGSNGKFNFTTELVNINPAPSLSLTASTNDVGSLNANLNLADGQTGNLTSSSGKYTVQTSQPVNWTVTGSDGATVLTADNSVQFTFSSGGTSFVSAPVAGQQGVVPTSYTVTATLLADPSQTIAVNVND